MKKRTIFSILFILSFIFSATALAEESKIEVWIDGEQIQFEQGPFIKDGITFVPFRALFSELGLNVKWNQDTKMVIGKNDGLTVELSLNNNQFTVNGEMIELLSPPELVNNFTYVPLRVVGESTGTSVQWNGEKKAISIMSSESQVNEQSESADSDYIVKVNGEKVDKDKLFDLMVQQLGKEKTDALVQQLIDQTLVAQQLAIEGLNVTDEEIADSVSKEIERFKASFGSDEEVEAYLLRYGMSLEDYQKIVEDMIPFQLQIEKLFESKIEITDEEIATYYEANLSTYTEEEQVKASHILVETKEEAESILQQINDGTDFSELAIEHSIDPGSGSNGGDLGFFGRGVMVPEFEEAAFNLSTGEISEIVQSNFGFHIIKVTDKKEEKTPTLEEKQEEIKEELSKVKTREQYQLWIEEVKTESEIEILF
ncbi:stalk domain-containing protein [Chengkuizengella marina]|uniref:stalk domain-containing protein n=1 Tax=Chengkuizengella marina TaxID=2507566 RepID=UPI00137188F0|nr:peptidylprolyl isomerase [Chengkuizengella marina]